MTKPWWKMWGKSNDDSRPISSSDIMQWSHWPSCYERHLQRRHINPLFSSERRSVTFLEVEDARRKDQEDAASLTNEYKSAIQNFLNSTKELSVDNLSQFRSIVDDFSHRALEIGGAAGASIIELLRRNWDTMFNGVEQSCADNPELQKIFLNAKYDQERLGLFSMNSFIAQVSRKDSPIKPDEIVASVLMEDTDTLRIAIQEIDNPKERAAAVTAALNGIQKAIEEDFSIQDIDQKIVFLSSLKEFE